MNKISKIIITCIVFFMMTTAIYATTEILPESKFGIKKVAVLGAGVFLVVQILFIAYQKDISLEKAKTEEKNNEEKFLDVDIINQNNENKVQVQEIKLENKKPTLDELTKILKEEKDLFSKIPVEKEIETLPDKMSPKKRNIKLKKEVYVEEKISKKPRNTRIVSRNEVKIVRERKNRNIGNKENENNREERKLEKEKIKKTVKSEGRIKTKTAKQEGVAKKNSIKIDGEIKKISNKKSGETRKKATKEVGKVIKKENKK